MRTRRCVDFALMSSSRGARRPLTLQRRESRAPTPRIVKRSRKPPMPGIGGHAHSVQAELTGKEVCGGVEKQLGREE